MPQYERVVIIGVGLLGGSIGLALRKRGLANRVIGIGRNLLSLEQARKLGAITDVSQSLQSACENADLVVVCTPVQQISLWVNTCSELPLSSNCLITDVGSTKSNIVGSVDQSAHSRFCGSHPIAGSERSGVQFASAELLEGRMTIVTPTSATPAQVAVRIEEFWHSIGSQTQQMTAAEHDQAIANISHLPHLIASALACATESELLPLVGTGWQDTTRIAAGGVEMWQQIVAENSKPILQALNGFTLHLQEWIEVIESGNSKQLVKLLECGKSKRDSVS